MHGIRVTVIADAVVASGLFETVDRALALIQQFDARRHRRLTRDVRRILVYEWPLTLGSGGLYSHRLRMIQLNATVLREYGSGAWVSAALALVHEATHARIQLTSREYATRPERDRIREERACTNAELDFVRRLPDPALLEAAVLEKFTGLDEGYSDAERAKRSFAVIAELRRELRELWTALRRQ